MRNARRTEACIMKHANASERERERTTKSSGGGSEGDGAACPGNQQRLRQPPIHPIATAFIRAKPCMAAVAMLAVMYWSHRALRGQYHRQCNSDLIRVVFFHQSPLCVNLSGMLVIVEAATRQVFAFIAVNVWSALGSAGIAMAGCAAAAAASAASSMGAPDSTNHSRKQEPHTDPSADGEETGRPSSNLLLPGPRRMRGTRPNANKSHSSFVTRFAAFIGGGCGVGGGGGGGGGAGGACATGGLVSTVAAVVANTLESVSPTDGPPVGTPMTAAVTSPAY
jgi:hypothetical protein